jgi:hypothetical protein
MIKIILDGVILDTINDVSGEGLTTIEVRDSDDQENRVRNVSQSYTLTGAAYNLVAASFIDNPEGKNLSLPVKIYDSGCCDSDTLLFEGRITSDNVKWCHGICSCDVVFEEYTEDTRAMDCLKNTLVYDNTNGFQSIQHPRMVYCVDLRPDVLQYFVFVGFVQLNLIFILLTPIVFALSLMNSILQTIENVINSIPPFNINISLNFDGNNATSILEEYFNLLNVLNQNVIGCGRAHPSPLVRDYIKNVCDICGLEFQSTILNNPSSDYYNMVYLFAPVEKGTRNENVFWIDNNKPIYAGKEFLDALKPVCNAKWEVRDSVLYFERKDFFDVGQSFVNYLDLKEQGLVEEHLCLEWRNEDRPAYLQAEYQMDAIDAAANEALFLYNEIVEWNQPVSDLQIGSKKLLLTFGANKFRNDGAGDDSFEFYEQLPYIGPILQQYNKAMSIQKHMTMLPRLIIWDGQSRVNGYAKRYLKPEGLPAVVPINTTSRVYVNFPLIFNEYDTEPNTAYPSNRPDSSIYQRFYAWENPKLFRDLGKSFTFSFRYNCQQLQEIFEAQYVGLPLGTNAEIITGRITQITVNLQSSTIILQGNV